MARRDPEDRAVALVTGANRGIGLEVCRPLARRRYAVLLGSRDAAQGERAARELAQDGQTGAGGAASVVWAATLADDGPTGGFFRDSRPVAW